MVFGNWRSAAALLVFGLGLCPGGAVAQAAAGAAVAGASIDSARAEVAREQVIDNLNGWAERLFSLPAAMSLDADLRRDAEALLAEHRTRVRASAAAWVAEEQSLLGADASAGALSLPVMARLANELALWQLDSTGETHDALMLRALRSPVFCRARSTIAPVHTLLAALQSLPAPERAAALAAQRSLLQRWGQPREVPPRPDLHLPDHALAALQGLRALARPVHEPPLPPVLAWNQLSTPPRTLGPAHRCALLQWALQREDLRQAPAAEQLNLLRYGLLFVAADWLSERDAPAVNDAGYPTLAARFEVTGDIAVAGRVRSSGEGLEALRIVAREINVPGIRGVRPVAFDTALDAASLERAAAVTLDRATPGVARTLSFNWRLQ
jgi:hypothetical protein